MTILYRGGPTALPLRVTAMRPPESGYAYSIPDTWYRQHFAPETATWPHIMSHNTGWSTPPWESGSPVISTGSNVVVDRTLTDRATGGWGTVSVKESGGTGARWCCPWGHFWCDAEDCAQQDADAAKAAAAQSGVEQTVYYEEPPATGEAAREAFDRMDEARMTREYGERVPYDPKYDPRQPTKEAAEIQRGNMPSKTGAGAKAVAQLPGSIPRESWFFRQSVGTRYAIVLGGVAALGAVAATYAATRR